MIFSWAVPVVIVGHRPSISFAIIIILSLRSVRVAQCVRSVPVTSEVVGSLLHALIAQYYFCRANNALVDAQLHNSLLKKSWTLCSYAELCHVTVLFTAIFLVIFMSRNGGVPSKDSITWFILPNLREISQRRWESYMQPSPCWHTDFDQCGRKTEGWCSSPASALH